ncbi:glycerophosphodiester phosphodiesterase family protein [Vibrio sp. TH_r3]|uniref:glycerophosphodiester phosphodiesterase family protein n=1 Tax=Vibrio sp. TH_r3 TaxID=3082084 RepID=UPI00295422A5|nr:glycerophosphodiester phosphodiesterase family protein [Vibrio sp. TH_r3]MDV7104936.1 glycerophosphodiester phosphodiesterase family protein [Vibrio sp. TH_r3]
MIVGHRGAAALAPENTLAGMKKASEVGIHWVEIDTQLTADGVPVVFHDETLQRCTNGTGKLAAHTYDEIKTLDAGSWFGEEFVAESIPSLEEALQTCLNEDLSINLEIKVHHDEQAFPLVKNVASVIHSSGFPIEKLLLSSFCIKAVEACMLHMPEIRRGYITEQKSSDYLPELEHLGLFSIHVNQEVLTSEMAKSITDKGYTLNIWTLNEPNKVDDFTQMKVTNIITDNPLLFS